MTEMRKIETQGLFVEESGGTGRPVVLIHGWPLPAEAWEHQKGALADADYRVIAYDRRGFGRSDKPDSGYDYDSLTNDLESLMAELGLTDATLVGFSMGGGEVARYVGKIGEDKLRSIVFASAVPPYLMQTDDNPDGPLTDEQAEEFETSLKDDREAFFESFVKDFYTADGSFRVSEEEGEKAKQLCLQSSQAAALGAMEAWATTDFRDDLKKVTVPTLVLHGSADGVVPFEGSGKRTHDMIQGSEVHVIEGAPHGCNVSHAEEWNRVLLDFLSR